MYLPAQFEESRIEVLHALVRERPFGTLVTLTSAGLVANHLPFELDPAPAPFGTLRAHVARANPLWREHDGRVQALAIFHGPHAYISPRWYPSRQQGGRVVPTWNYAVVHAYGELRVIEDRAWLRRHLGRLTRAQEAAAARPWKLEDVPADYYEQLAGAIVGIELKLARLMGKWKVSQNRPAADRQGVIEALRARGDAEALAVAALVEEYDARARRPTPAN